MKTLSIIHPFTPQAAGVVEKSVTTYHSQPHLKAMELLSKNDSWKCRMEYFTPKFSKYTSVFNQVEYLFYPVTRTWNGDHKKWKKQQSASCFKAYSKNTPDVTIINMSGHSSPFSHQLGKLILQKGKSYVAMLGGQHYSDSTENRVYYESAHHILVHTTLQKKQMEAMPMFKDLDIRVFPLGVDISQFSLKERKENIVPRLLYVGRIVPLKRIHLAIEAVKTLKENGFPQTELDIIGPVSSEVYLETLKQQVRDSDLKENVFFLGHKEHAELPPYFQKADLFTLPSDKETFGMVMIEAMASGTPVAGIDCPGGPADVITPWKNGLLTTPEKYATTILEYFKNPSLAADISKKAHEKVVGEYSLEATYRVLKESVYAAIK